MSRMPAVTFSDLVAGVITLRRTMLASMMHASCSTTVVAMQGKVRTNLWYRIAVESDSPSSSRGRARGEVRRRARAGQQGLGPHPWCGRDDDDDDDDDGARARRRTNVKYEY